jgi:outer membrane receptor for ferrienterochelin and colicin
VEALDLDSSFSVDYIAGRTALPAGEGFVDEALMSPEWMLKWRLSLTPWRRLRLHVDQAWCTDWRARHIRSQADYADPFFQVDGYYLMDLAARYDCGRGVVAFAQCQNVWDRAYAGIDAYEKNNLRYNPQIGRAFYAGLEYRF